MKLKLMEMGYTEKQVLMFETMSAEQLVHIFDEASTVVHKALKAGDRGGWSILLFHFYDMHSRLKASLLYTTWLLRWRREIKSLT